MDPDFMLIPKNSEWSLLLWVISLWGRIKGDAITE